MIRSVMIAIIVEKLETAIKLITILTALVMLVIIALTYLILIKLILIAMAWVMLVKITNRQSLFQLMTMMEIYGLTLMIIVQAFGIRRKLTMM